jgi:hypothetical protein
MTTPPTIDGIMVASAIAGVAPTDLAVAIATAQVTTVVAPDTLAATLATIQVATTASHERAAGVIIAACTAVGATATVRPHPPVGLPFSVADTSAPAGPVAGTASPLAATTVVGALVGIAAGAACPLATTVVAGTPASFPVQQVVLAQCNYSSFP